MATASQSRKRKGRGKVLAGFDASIEEQSSLDQYLRDVSRHELITPDMEKELGYKAQKGDQDAIQELARANLRFVISVAKKYQNRGVSLTDSDPGGERRAGYGCPEVRSRPGSEVHQLRGVVDPTGHPRFAGEPWTFRSGAVEPCLRPGPDLPRKRAAQAGIGTRSESSEELGKATGLTPEMVESLQTLNAAEIRLDAPIGDS